MRPVDLDNRLNDPLFNAVKAIQFLIQDLTCLLRVYGGKMSILPFDIEHHGKCSLSVPALLRRYFRGFRDCQITSGPKAYIIGQRTAGTFDIVCNTLNAGKLHIISIIDVI